MNCETCDFVRKHVASNTMTCHRYPPGTNNRWPYVNASDECGEWLGPEEPSETMPPWLVVICCLGFVAVTVFAGVFFHG